MQFFKIFLLVLFTTYLLLLASIFIRRFFRGSEDTEEHQQPELLHGQTREAPLIEIINVKKAFEEPVLRGVSLTIHRGMTMGVLGKSGTGKSVLLKLVAGFLKPDDGMILYKGLEITRFSEQQLLEFRKRVSYVFQSGAFFDFLNVRENIAYPLRERGLIETEISERIEYLLDAVELNGMGNFRYDELSVGAKKQVAIARSIAINPEVILYDEPTTGVDPIIGKSLSRLIRKLGQQEKFTSIVVTHDLKCLEIVADEIVLLKDGHIRFQGSKEDFAHSEDPFVEAFRTGRRYSETQDPYALTVSPET